MIEQSRLSGRQCQFAKEWASQVRSPSICRGRGRLTAKQGESLHDRFPFPAEALQSIVIGQTHFAKSIEDRLQIRGGVLNRVAYENSKVIAVQVAGFELIGVPAYF